MVDCFTKDGRFVFKFTSTGKITICGSGAGGRAVLHFKAKQTQRLHPGTRALPTLSQTYDDRAAH